MANEGLIYPKQFAALLNAEKSNVIERWVATCREQVPAAQDESWIFLRDHLPEVIDKLVSIMDSESPDPDFYKAMKLAHLHGRQRALSPEYAVPDILKEYRLLREILFSLGGNPEALAVTTVTGICSFIEASLANAIDEFLKFSVREHIERTEKQIHAETETRIAKEREARAQEAHNELYSFFMQAPVPMVILLGADHRFALANPPYERLVGRKVTGKTLYEAFSRDEVSFFEPLLDSVYNTGVPYLGKELPLSLPDENGVLKEYFVDVGYYPFLESDGTIKGVLAFAQDVTDQSRARKIIEASKAIMANERDNFRNLFRQSPEMVCILLGKEHTFEFVNEAHIKALGFDATGMTVRKAQPESVEVHGLLDSVYQTGETLALHEIPVTLTDRVRYFNLTYAARRNESNTVNGVMILGTEVTDQVEARRNIQASEVRFRNLADAMPQIVWTSDATGAVDYYNQKFSDYTGFSFEEAKGWGWQKAFHPEDAETTRVAWLKSVESGEPFHFEFRLRRGSDGSYRWHLGRAVPMKDDSGKIVKWYGTNTDIHEYKVLTEELRTAQKAAEAASEAKSSFLANMSHEIRTPLGAIMGFVDLMKHPGTEREELNSYISIISRNSEQLLRIIDDILDLSKVEAGKIELESIEVSLPELISDFSSLMGLQAREKGIRFETRATSELPEKILADPVRLRQILMNVVGNAIKFTEHGSVQLSISLSNRDSIEFKVTDTGRGISPEQAKQLFKPFTQADASTTRQFGGTGLGLVLTKKLSECMGGDFWLEESALGRGSQFIVRLPFHSVPSAKFIEPVALGFSNRVSAELPKDIITEKKLRVLLVEDSPDNQKLIQIYLRKLGCDVTLKTDGKQGLEAALAEDFDVILMDIQMPTMDGHEATRQLRARNYRKPIIALTAHAMNEERERAQDSGFTDFLSKPIQRDQLSSTLDKYRTH